MDAQDIGRIIGFIISLVLIYFGWGILNRKNRGWGYYVLLILFPLIGYIVASCLNDLSDEEPSNDINDITESQQNYTDSPE